MERIEAELFKDGGNDAVVRLPPRRFPGVLIQGDSLFNLRVDVAELHAACQRGDLGAAREVSQLLLRDLDGLLARYTHALDSHGIKRPF